MINQSKHFSPPNAIKYILKHLQHTFQLITYHISRFTHQNAHCSKYITTFQKTIRLIAEHSLIWHFRLPIKTLLASQRNQIYSEASSTHFSAINLSYTYAVPIILLLIQINTDISVHYQTYRGTQFNLILCDLPIKKLPSSQRKQIYSEASSTHFSAINLSCTYALLINAIKYILKHLQTLFSN